MFLSCCACEPTDANEFTPPDFLPPLDQVAALENREDPRAEDEPVHLEPEEREKEKEKLIHLVHAFAENALKGVACQQMNLTTEDITPCTFVLSKDLQSIELYDGNDAEPCIGDAPHSNGDPQETRQREPALQISLSHVQEIYLWSDLSRRPKLFNLARLPVFRAVTAAQRQQFVLLEYVDQDHYVMRKVLLVSRMFWDTQDLRGDVSPISTMYSSSATSAELFAKALCVLTLHCRETHLAEEERDGEAAAPMSTTEEDSGSVA